MIQSYEFLRLVLDTITEHIAVIDHDGNIVFVNRSWNRFGKDNHCLITDNWIGVNYLDVCDRSAEMGDQFGVKAADGIRKVIHSEEKLFYFEYPCHSPDEKRWFMMRVTQFTLQEISYFVISHQNITERRLAEEKVLSLSNIDGLTDIANRRCFDQFLSSEWRRCARLGMPVSLAIIDLDHFKLLNDTYGHQAGDDCLKKVGAALKPFAQRPGDICARYGGEEFAVVYGNTTLDNSRKLVDKIISAIRELGIPNKMSPTQKTLTASIGLATLYPDVSTSEKELIEVADTRLYSAKENGRDRVVFKSV